MTIAISTLNLSHTFPSSRHAPSRQALIEVSLSVPEGIIYGLLGPNGGGKSTLFRILSTALQPTSGHVEIFGKDVLQAPSAVRPFFGVVFQNPSLDKKLTLRENLMHQGHLYGLRGANLIEKIDSALDRLSLSSRKNDLVETLSGGLQRRVEIAKGLLHSPRLLIMDEPSTGLDPTARKDMWTTLLELKKTGMTILITTHLMDEGDKCDELMILSAGRTVAEGTPVALKNKIGADVITIQTTQPETVAAEMKKKWDCTPVVLEGQIRVEMKEGHKFIPALVEAFPGLISSVQLGQPTLEDVFVHETGRSFSSEEKG